MPDSASPPAPIPLARLEYLLRIQLPGAPDADIKGALDDLVQLAGTGGIGSAVEAAASPASDEVVSRVATIEREIEALKGQVVAAPAPEADDPTVALRLDAIDRAFIALQGDVSKLEAASSAAAKDASAIEAIQKRVSALEARPAGSPARAAAPAARPAATA